MKILHVINELDVAGAQKVVVDLVLASQKLGHHVEVAVLVDRPTQFRDKLTDAGIKIHRLSSINNRFDPLIWLRLSKLMKGFDVVHSHLFPAQHFTAFAKKFGRNMPPIITTEHSTTNKRRKHKLFRWLDKKAYSQYAEIVACSENALLCLRNDFPGINARFIANGVDIGSIKSAVPYTPKELFGIETVDCVLVGMVARFDNPKRQDLVVEAMAKLPDNVHAVFIGDGRLRKEAEEKAATLGVAYRCHFLGIRNDVGSVLRSCQISCLISEYEGLSLSSIECMSSGAAFIGSDVNGIRPIAKEAGLLVNNDSDELAKAIEKLLYKDFRKEIADKCQERAELYSLDKCVNKYLTAYNRVIQHNHHNG